MRIVAAHDTPVPSGPMERSFDIAVIGAGAAGLMAAIWAGRTAGRGGKILAIDGAAKIGAKIMVAGGGRCNVTHDVVDESAYAGSTRPAIRNVLRRFDVPKTVEFFRELGVELKREETGKLFPVSDDARSVLEALLRAAREAGVELLHPWRVGGVDRTQSGDGSGFRITRACEAGSEAESIAASRVILATGGMALPRSGSDGAGYAMARALGHSTTARIFPALVPLTLPREHWICGLSGISARVGVRVSMPRDAGAAGGEGRVIAAFTDSLLCTHFGISGPAALDVSRYWLDARAAALEARTAGPTLRIHWVPDLSAEGIDRELVDRGKAGGGRGRGRGGGMSVLSAVQSLGSAPLPERLARAVIASGGVEASNPVASLTREDRKRLVAAIASCEVPAAGDRGFTFAEVTAGGVPLSEVQLKTMESRVFPGLHLCGEILDVDGRIGGYNFQWAWASGFVAGTAAGEAWGAAGPGGENPASQSPTNRS